MPSAIFSQIKNYIQFQHLLKQCEKSLSDSADFKEYSTQITTAYHNGENLDRYQKDIDALQSLQGTTPNSKGQPINYSFSSGNSIKEQFNYNMTYDDLVGNAENIFDTTAEYSNWKEQIDSAYNSHSSLDTFSYSLDMFDALQMAKYSPVYQSEVDTLVKAPEFDEFTTIAENIGENYLAPSFKATDSFTAALDNNRLTKDDITLFDYKAPDVNYNVSMPETNKSVIGIHDGVVTNSEAFYDENGLMNISQLTTLKEQQNKEEVFNELVASCDSQEEVECVVTSFEPEQMQVSDPEALTLGSEEMGNLQKPDYNESLVDNVIGTFDLAPVNFTLAIMDSSKQEDLEFIRKLRMEDMFGVGQGQNGASQNEDGIEQSLDDSVMEPSC